MLLEHELDIIVKYSANLSANAANDDGNKLGWPLSLHIDW